MRCAMLFALLTLLWSPGASAVVLQRNDLVVINNGRGAGLPGAAGIYRVDGVTGAQDLIASGVFGDVAVVDRGRRIYATTAGSELVEIDPATGAQRVLAMGFARAAGVAANESGDVFVIDAVPESGNPVPHLYRVDAATGETSLVLVSGLEPLQPSAPAAYRSLVDVELATETSVALLAEGWAFGGGGSGGVVLFDVEAHSETILFSDDTFQRDGVLGPRGFPALFVGPTGLGTRADGEVLAGCDGDFNCGGYAYDPETQQVRAIGAVESIYDSDGTFLIDFLVIDLAETSDGVLYVAPDRRNPVSPFGSELLGIYPVVEGACPTCVPGSDAAGVLVDGAPFSPGGGWTEIQAVRAPLPVSVDVRPAIRANLVNLSSNAPIPVALLGSESLDVRDVDRTTLAFGPAGAQLRHRFASWIHDVDLDGFEDLVGVFRTAETGIAFGDRTACLTGALLDGSDFEGCDAIHTLPPCGLGIELTLVLPPLLALYRRRRFLNGPPSPRAGPQPN